MPLVPVVILKIFGLLNTSRQYRYGVTYHYGSWLMAKLFAVVAATQATCSESYALTTSLYFDNLEYDIFDAGSPQCHFHICYHCG